jgi:anti-anti-sigma factor
MMGKVPDSPRPSPGSADDPAEPAARTPSAGRVEPVLDQALHADSLYQLRASVAAHAVQAGLPQRRADDLVIAAHELAANVVRHGSGRGRLRIWREDQMLHCQVTDDGFPQRPRSNGRDIEMQADPLATPTPWLVRRGHGLWLVRQLADQTSLHPGLNGSAVTISFALGSAESFQPFTLSEDTGGEGSTVITIAGQLDLNSADELTHAVERALSNDPAVRLVIDLAGLTFWDAFGLAGMLRAQSRVDASAGASLSLTSVPARLALHLQETGLAERFTQFR